MDSVIDSSHQPKGEETELVYLDIFANIDWIISASEHGYTESTGEKTEKYISFRSRHIEIEKIHRYDRSAFLALLNSIENYIFIFVSNSISILEYSDQLESIWQSYKEEVDEKLVEIGLNNHLDTIQKGLSSENPQDWRASMWSCRDILHDLANYLWQDTREIYEHLPGSEGKLKVTKDKYVNRLGAYLHQKGITGELRSYLSYEMERIYDSIDHLNDLDSTAHDIINLSEVQTAAIGTYIILGELCKRTDMKPIERYS